MADYTTTGIIHNTSVDFTRRVISEPVHIVQGDRTLPTLAVELLADGQPYTVPDGAQVNIALNKKDGTFVLNKADSVDGNIATFTITAQMAAVSGDFTPEVQIVNRAGQATTGKFPYIVDKAEIQEGMIESTSEGTALISYVDKAEAAADRAQEAADKADTVAINTEAAEKAATDAAASATAAATSEKNAADSAIAAADSAKAADTSATNAKASEDAAAKTLTDVNDAKDAAVNAVDAAKTEALTAVKADKDAAAKSATDAADSATLARSYARGDTATRDGEDTDNAKYYMEQAQKAALGNLDDKMSDTSTNAVQNKVIKAYVDGKTPATATADTLGIVKPDNSTITIDEDGTLHGSAKVAIATTEALGIVKPDGDTITIDEDGTIHGTPSVLQLKITFAEAFKGAQYTITGGSESYSGTVPDSLQVVQKVEAYNTTYTISSTANGTKYSTTAATEKFAGEYTAELNAFTATINVTVTAAGAKVSGATATATLNGKTYTATTNSSGVAAVKVYSAGTYAISATYRDYAETSGSSVAISTNEQIASGSVAIFGATLTVDADISGRTSSATNTITVTDGTHKQTATITANGSKVFTIYYAGTYTVSMTNGTDTSASVSVDCKTDGGTPSASISYFKATLTVTVVNGTGATITATDGTHTYTAEESSGTATLSIYATGTYTVSAELSGETGVLTASVTVDTDGGSYTANVGFASTTLNDNDWDVISAVSAAGLGDTLWDVGDCKAVEVSGTVGTLSLNDTYYAFIIGFNHNSAVEGEGITFQGFKTAATGGTDIALCDSYYDQYQSYDGTKCFQMNHWGTSDNYNTNYGGWPACDMRYDILGSTDQAPSGYGSQKATGATGTDPSDTCATSPKANTLMAALPAALRAVMKPITKVTDGVGNSSNAEANLRTTKDYLPLLAEFEIFGARTYANQYEQNHQKQYDYYKNGNPKIKYNHSATTTAVVWWERSARYANAIHFCSVYTNGSALNSAASYSIGLAPAFLI